MKDLKKRFALLLTICITLSLTLAMTAISFESKAANKKTKTIKINLTQKNDSVGYHLQFSKKSSKWLKVKIKITKINGKPTDKVLPTWIAEGTDNGKGSLFYGLNRAKIKKGSVLNVKYSYSKEWPVKNTYNEFWLPRGVKSMTLKVTYTADSNIIKSLKKYKCSKASEYYSWWDEKE